MADRRRADGEHDDDHEGAADDDPVLVPISNERPFEFLKRWRGTADKLGESVGFFKIAPKDLALLKEETQARSVGRLRLDSMDEVLRALVKADRFGYEDVTGLPWTEIDFPADIAYAREHVLASLQDLRHGILPRPR